MTARLPAPRGYDALAGLISHYPDLAVFRLFKDLNASNLLDLQAELVQLRRELQIYGFHGDSSECLQDDPLQTSFRHLIGADEQNCPYHQRIWQMKLEIRKKLKQYNEAHLHFERLTTHRKPTSREIKALRTWLGHKDGGKHFLQGAESYTWSEEAENDLACFGMQGKDTDALSTWLAGPVLQWFHLKFGNRRYDAHSLAESQPPVDHLGPLYHYSDSYISVAVNVTVTILASLLPNLPIFVLYYLQNQVARMGAILAMTFAFSTLVTLLTSAKQFEIFAAATAFTAVQVVFVSNSNATQIP